MERIYICIYIHTHTYTHIYIYSEDLLDYLPSLKISTFPLKFMCSNIFMLVA